MILAKRYAIMQGQYIEYLAAAVGYLAFQPATFDAIFALHSIHHVPNLRQEMVIIRSWLREGGAIAVDEHIRNNPTLAAMAGQLAAWAQTEVYPPLRTLDPLILAGLPQAGSSSLEDAGSEEVIDAVLDNFTLVDFSGRFVSLDALSFIYYLSRGQDEEGYHYSANVLDRLYRAWSAAIPTSVEYVMMVGHTGGRGWPERERTGRARAAGPGGHAGRNSAGVRRQLHAANTRLTAANSELQTTNAELHQYIADLETSISAKNTYIAELEGVVAVKNQHIVRLESLLRRQQQLLSALPVRIGARLHRNLTPVRRRE